MAVVATALVANVGVTRLNNAGGQPSIMSKSRLLSLGESVTVNPWQFQGYNKTPLVTELTNLYQGNLVSVAIDGVAIVSVSEISAYADNCDAFGGGDIAMIRAANTDGLMGIPVHNKCEGLVGAWSEVYDNVAYQYRFEKAAAAEVGRFTIDIDSLPLRGTASRGRKILGFDLWYRVQTADIDEITPRLIVTPQPTAATGVAPVPVNLSAVGGGQTYDAAHDTTPERVAQGYHRMTVTLDALAQTYLILGQQLHLDILVDTTVGAAAVFGYLGGRLRFEERLVD